MQKARTGVWRRRSARAVIGWSTRRFIATLPIEPVMNLGFSPIGRSAASKASAAGKGHRGRKVGNAITSRIDGLSVSSMTSRSMPTPSPPQGGKPYSRAVT